MNNAPSGTTVSGVLYQSDTEADVTLAFDGTDFDSDFTSFNITCAAVELSRAADITSDNLSITATDDAETLAISGGAYTEGSEDGETVTVTLTGGTFASGLTPGNWSLNNAPVGVGVLSVNRDNATQITLTFDGNRTTDYDANITTMTVTAGLAEIDDNGTGVTSSTGVTFNATSESAAITSGGTTESNLDGEVIRYTMTGETFTDITLDKNNFTLNNAPTGTTIASVLYQSDTEVDVTLAFDGTDFDVTVTTFSIKIPLVDDEK